MQEAPPTLTERLLARASETPSGVAFLSAGSDGSWQTATWGEVATRARALAHALSSLGLASGDRVAIMLPTTVQWEYCHHAALALGGIVVGLDAHDSPQNLHHILELTRPRVLIVDNNADLQRIQQIWRAPEIAVMSDVSGAASGTLSLTELLNTEVEGALPRALPGPDQTATIIFTSGSTGQPKGIAYSHQQIGLACDAILERFPSITDDACLVCWLPLSNLFQRIINLCALGCGARSYFVSNPLEIGQLLPQIEPTLFIGVPRFFEKLHAGIIAELKKRPAPIRLMVQGAWTIAVRAAELQRAAGSSTLLSRMMFAVANPVLHPLRRLMGRRLQFMVSGSAPLPRWLMDRFHGLGWLVLEAYGISENVMPVALNTPTSYRFGSVGCALPGNELVIGEDSELLVRGPGVFSGHYVGGDQESPINQDGFLQTGDYARIDPEGYVWLLGRKSEVFKTSTGRRIAPAPIEAALSQIDYVDQAVIVGRDRPFPVAIITLRPGHPITNQVSATKASLRLGEEVAAACLAFTDYQRPGAVIVSTHTLSISAGELTANLKIRRKAIEARFQKEIDEAYRQPSRKSADRTSYPQLTVIMAP